LHPNPASSYVNISSIDKPVAVYTQHGVCVMRDVEQSTIDVSMFPAGLYFIVSGSQVQKLVIER
jgi:hypothetical protein